ncbi:MAG TPA: hypothetical protein VE974_12425 [Thermoanaerobaculia bacterium]|nr:hypothetical protein [Thermoanaerobaculia bacterium]
MKSFIDHDSDGAARALSLFRILLALTLIVQALQTAPLLPLLAGERGLMQLPLNDALAPAALPRLSWLSALWESGLATERQVLYAALTGYTVSLFYLLIGYRTALFAAVSLVLHLFFKGSAFTSSYGMHELATNALFFCIVLPAGRQFCFREERGWISTGAAQLFLRLYLTIVYVSSGIEKATGEMWRSGDAIWSFLMRPEVTIAGFAWLSRVPWLAPILAWSVLLIETGYFACLFSRRTRTVWFVLTLLLHLGIAVTYHLWAFSATMTALNCGALLADVPFVKRGIARTPNAIAISGCRATAARR